MGAFHRLHPHLQHGIVHDLGWRSLRPVQELAIDAVLDGCNAVVLAPTAGGKTEASVFPLLSRILTENLQPVSVLYVCPIRALLNNQEERIGQYARMVGLESFKWHGDVAESKRKRFRASPAHLLLTTPESIEVMMISAKTDARALFRGLSAVIVDEVHAFAGDDRGAHLAALLERLTRFCGRDLQRIGLSATVGNPLQIGEWLQGSSARPLRLVDPPRPRGGSELRVDSCASVAEAGARIGRIARGRKSLVFVESRAKAERIAHALGGSDVDVFIHHSSVSRAERAMAEERFTSGENTAIVCTSTMELGIDVGDLDQIVQVDAPTSVASYLQRIGRTGRRAGTVQRAFFFCFTPESLLQAVAILRLAHAGWVEEVRPPVHAMHVLAHQTLAIALQEGGLSRHQLASWVRGAYPFAGIRTGRVTELLDTMLEREILYEADGLLSLGAEGERVYGRRNFFELYAVFSSPPLLRVLHGRTEVGTVQAGFVLAHDGSHGPLCFRLGGQAWQVVAVELGRGRVQVRVAERGAVPNWLGTPGVLSASLCQAMKDTLLCPGAEERWLTDRARSELASLRAGYEDLLAPGEAPLEGRAGEVTWHTFAGGAVNRLLAAGLETQTKKRWVAGNLSVRSKETGLQDALLAVQALPRLDWEELAIRVAGHLVRGRVSKFQPCLPPAAENRLLADRLLDAAGAARFLARVSVQGRTLAGPPDGLRLQDAKVTARRLPAAGPKASPAPVDAAAPTNPLVWIGDLPSLEAACTQLAQADLLGLDVKTSLDFHSLCLIQIADRERTYLIDALALDDLRPLQPILEATVPTKIAHSASFERRVLASVDIRLGKTLDTMQLSRKTRGQDAPGGHTLAAVCRRELTLTLDRTPQTSNWTRRPLTADQLHYAALDAEVLLRLQDAFFSTSG